MDKDSSPDTNVTELPTEPLTVILEFLLHQNGEILALQEFTYHHLLSSIPDTPPEMWEKYRSDLVRAKGNQEKLEAYIHATRYEIAALRQNSNRPLSLPSRIKRRLRRWLFDCPVNRQTEVTLKLLQRSASPKSLKKE